MVAMIIRSFYKFYQFLFSNFINIKYEKSKSDIYDNKLTVLSNAVPGSYKFIIVNCDKKSYYRLLEMGFIPSEKLIVISNIKNKGCTIVKVKGSKIILSDKIAKHIFLKRDGNEYC
ncbi:MAG: ferrous iron transport protein A [Endomicrobium sp.]|jgi:Fe2+ transport system protein FeoA|nr:ferrous iron transport protein A [Endomicrobium sp.]